MSNEDQLEWLEDIACDKGPDMIEYIHGDLFLTDCRYIAHGVNCQGVMGSGVAKIVKERFPKSFKVYKRIVDQNSYLTLGHVVFSEEDEHDKRIVHCFTQNNYGKDGARYVNYEYMYQAFSNLAKAPVIINAGVIAMPKIGAGLGGGDWNIIEAIIRNTLCKSGIKVKVYSID